MSASTCPSVAFEQLPETIARRPVGGGNSAARGVGTMPQFAGRPIQLANRVNGAPIADQGLRLIVPGERRGGRSVRDVVRIDIE